MKRIHWLLLAAMTLVVARPAQGLSETQCSMLRIVVRTMPHVLRDCPGYLAQCGVGTITLKGIGNQAVRCISRSGVNKGEDLIIGGVRDRAFIITIKAEWIPAALERDEDQKPHQRRLREHSRTGSGIHVLAKPQALAC